MPQTFNVWWSGGASQAWLTVVSRITVFPWLGFAIALTTPHAVLLDNSVTVRGLLVMMALSIPLEFTDRTLSRINESWP